ncbi:MAG: hypothetical protein ACE5H4_14505 [Candidatus Thorarchaeota archaeon]
MKRNQAVLVVAGALILALGWVFDPWIVGPWDTILFAVPLSLVGTFLILQFMEEYEDERLAHIRNISARNGYLFVLLALPLVWTSTLFLQISALTTAGLVFLVWFASLGVLYLSGIYYYRR